MNNPKLALPPVKHEVLKLTATEKKLLLHIKAQAPAKPSLFKFLSSTACGFWY